MNTEIIRPIATAVTYTAWIMGLSLAILGTVTTGLSISQYLLIRILKQCRAWVWIVDYFLNRRRFKAWIKAERNTPNQ